MSQPYRAAQIITCPFCRVPHRPDHLGQGVLLCETAGQVFRVVHANAGKTGRRLAAQVEQKVRWENP